MTEERIYNVTKTDIKCCAKDCVTNDCDRYFFPFPSCDASDKNSIERCRTWVKNAGNIELLKCKSSELSDKFYLCCHHFPDWTAINNSQRYIAVDAVPTIFNSSPLSGRDLRSFPISTDLADEPNPSEGMDCQSPKDKTDDSIPDPDPIIPDPDPIIPDPDPASFSSILDTLEKIKTEKAEFELNNSCSSITENPVSEDDTPLVQRDPSKQSAEQSSRDPRAKKRAHNKRKCSTEKASSRPSRKAKEDAVNRISKQFIPVTKGSDRSETYIFDKFCPAESPQSCANGSESSATSPEWSANGPEFSTNSSERSDEFEEKIPSPSASPKAINTNSSNPIPRKIILSSTSSSPERAAAKYRIVSKDVVSKLGAVVSLNAAPMRSNEGWRMELGNKVTVLQEPGSKSRQDKFHVVVAPPPSQQASLVKESSGLRSILPKPRVVSSLKDKSSVPSFNLITVPRVDKNFCSAPFDNVTPILRTTSTQTDSNSSDTERLVFKILDCDSKLSVFTGLPSYDVLDKITDATLRMVISNKTTISDIEPTMRMWIMLTCTKFMLGISIEALSVMYDISEGECLKVIEKTSLFLRKTLSLPDCQKYVWMLPDQVLKGVADFSESMVY